MTMKRLAVGAFALGLVAGPALAHHGDAGRYKETVKTIAGTVVAVKLVNPHSWIMLDVPGDNGEVVRWQLELTGSAQLERNYGWTRKTLQPGDKITVTGRPIRSGAPYFSLSEYARIVKTDTGEELYRTKDYGESNTPDEHD